MHRKERFKQVLEESDDFLIFPKQNCALNRGKSIKNGLTRMRNSFLEKVLHNSE
jgi:hypothetical protein